MGKISQLQALKKVKEFVESNPDVLEELIKFLEGFRK